MYVSWNIWNIVIESYGKFFKTLGTNQILKTFSLIEMPKRSVTTLLLNYLYTIYTNMIEFKNFPKHYTQV